MRPVVAHEAQGRAGAKAAQQARPAQQTPDPESEFAAQLGRGFSAIMRQNGGSLTLRLQPQDLGEMTIRMGLQPGKVTAAFEVESEQARQLLDANMTTLRSALEARGLGVESLTVHVSDAGRSTPEALATDPAEPGNHGGANAPNPEGGTPGDRGGTGADRPTADGAIAPARSENQVSPDAGVAPGVEVGGAQVVRLVLDAVA